MAKRSIPNPDVKFLNPDGTVAQAWFDFLRSVDLLKLTDLRDVPQSSAPANGDTVRFSTTSNSWTYGA
jgi:hypothetical protein